MDQIKDDAIFIDCTHILKVTGRYFLQNINNVLNGCIHDLDVYLQHHCNHVIRWQNTEYYGIRKTILKDFLSTVLNEGLIEQKIYDFILKNNSGNAISGFCFKRITFIYDSKKPFPYPKNCLKTAIRERKPILKLLF